MITEIDTNVLIDILEDSAEFYDKSARLLKYQSSLGSLVISPVVLSEILVFFLHKHEKKQASLKLEEFLNSLGIEIVPFDKEDFTSAAESWLKFSPKNEVACPNCGTINAFSCKKCRSVIKWRNHLITDFLIGAHTQNHADVVLTRDSGYYKKYFEIRILP